MIENMLLKINKTTNSAALVIKFDRLMALQSCFKRIRSDGEAQLVKCMNPTCFSSLYLNS